MLTADLAMPVTTGEGKFAARSLAWKIETLRFGSEQRPLDPLEFETQQTKRFLSYDYCFWRQTWTCHGLKTKHLSLTPSQFSDA